MLRREILLTLVLFASCAARKPGDPITPGYNLYSKEQDIQIGREAAAQVRRQVSLVENRELQSYVQAIGRRLASQPAAGDFPYSFALINDDSINAFALPGGPIFVNTGLLTAADNEAQVAGVLAHEISHVALRHATNQATKANIVQLPAILAGAVIGTDSVLAQLGQLGLGVGVNALLLKYSRSAESEADALGARIMSQAGYNPIESARFFEKLEAGGGRRAPQFLSSHPNPGNRVRAVQAEIQALPRSQYTASAGDFARMKSLAAQLPSPRKPGSPAVSSAAPSPPSRDYRRLDTRNFSLAYPANWETFGDRDSAVVTIAPREGLVQGPNGGPQVGYGAVLSYYSPRNVGGVREATDELIQELRSVNRNLRVATSPRSTRVDGSPALLTTLRGASPWGGEETNVLLTVQRPEGLFYMVFVGPRAQFSRLEGAFDQMLDSIDFRG